MSPFLKVSLFVCALSSIGYVRAQNDVPEPASLTEVLGDYEYVVETNQRVNFHRALQLCAVQNMTLVSLETNDQITPLRTYLFTNYLIGARFWTSATDLPKSREFVWLGSGNRVRYNNWAGSQPSSNNKLRCVVTNIQFKLTTADCSTENYYICSRPKVPLCGSDGSCLAI